MKKLSPKLRKELVSFATTLAAALGMALLVWLESDVPLTKAALTAVLGSGLRSGLKLGLSKLLK